MTVSIIIPVYNEQNHIKACLDAVATQTVAPNQVIVVDNNCSDDTIKIARTYAFVEIVSEQTQGMASARTAGFAHAHGDVLCRIDADSQIAESWVETLQDYFVSHSDTAAVTGVGATPFLPLVRVRTTVFTRLYYWFAQAYFRTPIVWGANMAVRRVWWKQVANHASNPPTNVHEDQDLSLWLAAAGGRIDVVTQMQIQTTEDYRYLPKGLTYWAMLRRTRARHRDNGNIEALGSRRLSVWQVLPRGLFSVMALSVWIAYSVVLFPFDWLRLRSRDRPVA